MKPGHRIEINYAGWLEDGAEFVNTWLSPDSVTVTLGSNGLLPAFEAQLLTMGRGERKTFTVPCEEAYGPYDPRGIVSVPTKSFPNARELPVGRYIAFTVGSAPARAKVVSVDGDTVVFDTNHELAGHDLRFEVELVDDGESTAIDREGDSTGCGCNRLRESLGGCDHHHHH